MILYGRYRSPFTRRVAIAMRLYGLTYEHRPITAWTHLEELRELNPVGRVPALQLDSGELLFDSYAILDYLDQLVGFENALIPAIGPERRRVQRIIACAMGALEKVVHALYARTMYPRDKHHDPWIEHNEAQARSAICWLESSTWLTGAEFTHADIATVVMLDFTHIVNPSLLGPGLYPKLEALSSRATQESAFRETYPSSGVDQADPGLRS